MVGRMKKGVKAEGGDELRVLEVISLPRQRRVMGRWSHVYSPQSELMSKDDGSRRRSTSTSCNHKEMMEVREEAESCGVWQAWS